MLVSNTTFSLNFNVPLTPWFLTFFLYFTGNWMKLSQCNLSVLALGQKASVFCTELGHSLPLTCTSFLHNSGSPLFCFTDVSSCEWLNFTQKFLKTNLKRTIDLLLPTKTPCNSCLIRYLFLIGYFINRV